MQAPLNNDAEKPGFVRIPCLSAIKKDRYSCLVCRVASFEGASGFGYGCKWDLYRRFRQRHFYCHCDA